MPTLLLPPRYTDDAQRLWRAAIQASWGVRRLARGGDIEPVDAPVLYGESLFVRGVAERLGVTLLEPAVDLLPRLRAIAPALVGRDVSLRRLDEAWASTAPAFVKPADEKAFPAKVYATGTELRTESDAYAPETRVLVSEPVRFSVEYRCFVADGEVATASVYMRDGDIAEVEGEWPCDAGELAAAIAFAGKVAVTAVALVGPAAVVDVGLAEGIGWCLVEANPAWGSGLCGCDEAKVLAVLQRATVVEGA